MIWWNRIRRQLLHGMLLDYGISPGNDGVKQGGISGMSIAVSSIAQRFGNP